MAEKTALPTEEEVDKLKVVKLIGLLQELGMTEDEIEDMGKEELKAELKKRIREAQAAAATSRRPGQAAENLREILDIHNSKRASLAELCRSIAAYLANLDDSNKDNLKLQFDRTAQDILTDVQTQLHREECPILVAGETSSGKSTFLNLLLGGDILPVAHLSSTSTICEVKYGETKQAVVHLRKSGIIGKITGPKTVTIPLDGTDLEERQDELKSYMHLEGASRDKLPPAEKIEVFWPLPLLKGGIVIVDSPGVGESKMMDQVVADYMPKAFAFLYIIDSSRAGGVQQDRLGQLLQLYAEKENAEDFNPESAMFICNKWDLVLADVSPEEQDKVKSETFRKLSEMWTGLEESQVFFVSTKKAVGLGGILSEDFSKVLDGLDLLLPKSLDIKLDTQYRLLTRLSSAALTHIDVQLNVARQNLDKEGKAQKYRETMEHLKAFQEEAKQNMEELESMVRNNTKTTKAFLSHLVETGELKEKRLEIREKTFLFRPHLVVLGNEKKHSEGVHFSSFRTIYEEVARKSAQCSWFEEHIKPMERSFEQKTKEIVNSLQDACQQAMRVCTNNPRLEPIRQSLQVHDVLRPRGSLLFWFIWGGQSLRNRLARWGRSIAKAVLGSKSREESILHNYWKQAPEGTPLVDILMQALSSSEELITELAERQMQTQRDLMALLEADITKMTTLMDQTIDQTFKDARSNDEILQTYEPQSRDVNIFLGQLAMFHLTSTRRYEYELDKIKGWTDTKNRIGGGGFGEVFRVQVPRKGADTPAALKLGLMPYHIITTETASDFLKEEDNLGKLTGDHIVEYYGTACRREGGGLRLGLVMELCEGTLESRIIGNRDLNPAWWGSNPVKKAAAFSYTQNLAVQLCEGLKTIHDAGYIHRDLKLINVLVTKDTVKLADVGLTKQEVKITGTPTGTPLYAAPEVKERKVYDKSADIYSLGLILFEMWYGRTLYGLQDDIYSKRIEEDLKSGRDIRMPNWPDADPPIREWTRLIHDCLKLDPKKRPKIQECLDRIKAMQVE